MVNTEIISWLENQLKKEKVRRSGYGQFEFSKPSAYSIAKMKLEYALEIAYKEWKKDYEMLENKEDYEYIYKQSKA